MLGLLRLPERFDLAISCSLDRNSGDGAFNRCASSCAGLRLRKQLASGVTAPEAAQNLPLTPKAIRQIAIATTVAV